MALKSIADVFIIESLDFADEKSRKEGEIIFRALQMSGKSPIYHYVRTRQELQHFIGEFRASDYRYLHMSCHGNVDTFGLTLDALTGEDLADLFGNALDRRRLFLSTCLAANADFASKIFQRSSCFSVAGPIGEIAFDDSAVLWTAFYHLMFKDRPDAMNHKRLMLNLGKSALVFDQQMNVFLAEKNGRSRHIVLPPRSKKLEESDMP